MEAVSGAELQNLAASIEQRPNESAGLIVIRNNAFEV
jgi:hypothetical protein